MMQCPGHVIISLRTGRAVRRSAYPGAADGIGRYHEGRNVNIGDPNG